MSDYLSFRLTTKTYTGSDPIEWWRHIFGQTICQLDIDPIRERPFASEAIVRALPDLGMVSGVCSGATYARHSHQLPNDDLIFVVNHTGTDEARQNGRDAVIKPGEAVLMTAGESGGITNKSFTRFTTFSIPRHALAPMLSEADSLIAKPIPATNPMLQLLLNYVSVLEDEQSLATDRSRSLFAAHIHDLMALALGANRDATETAKRRGLRAARLRALKQDILCHLGEGDIHRVAQRNAVTPRYVQALFEQDGTTFSEFVLLQRLAMAHRILRQSGPPARRSITDIAMESGFGDVSYFNRTFRRHFNRTPSEVRHSDC